MTCERCGAEFERKPTGPEPKFCSKRCRKAANYERREKGQRREKYATDDGYRARVLANCADYRARNPEKCRESVRRALAKMDRSAYMAQYREENRERMRELARADRRRRRGALTDDGLEYAALLECDPCAYCGADGGEVDHIVALREGGDGGWENLTAACRSCNARKHRRPLLLFLLERTAA